MLEKLRADYEKRDRSTGIEPSVLSLEDYQDTYIASRAIDFIGGHRKDRPFFLWVDFVAPHPPADAPLPYATMYDPAKVRGKIPPPEGKVLRGRQKITEDEARKFRAAYYGMITLLDDQVGRIVAALEKTGQLDDRYKLITDPEGPMLFDLRANPDERVNLHGKLPVVQARLEREMAARLKATGPIKPPNPTPGRPAPKAKR